MVGRQSASTVLPHALAQPYPLRETGLCYGSGGTEKLSISCHISKQGCQSSAIADFQCELVNPKETQEGEEYLPSSNHQTIGIPYSEPQGSSGCEKYRTCQVTSVVSDSLQPYGV